MSTFTFSVQRRDLAWGVALIVLLTTIWVARGDIADAGGSPPGDGIAVVYVAVGTGFPDSLGVGPGAGLDGAPVIIVPTSPPMNAATSAELVRLDPRTVIIVGGTGVVSTAMEDAIKALLPNALVSRIAGANRYETNAMFSAATFPIEGWASIPASAFMTPNPHTDVAAIGGTFASNSTNGVLRAPIQLPHGAQILEFKVEASDDNAGASLDLTATLQRVNAFGPITNIATVATTGSGGFKTVTTTTIVAGAEIVDNETYTYIVYVTGTDAGLVFMTNARVRYRLGSSTG